MKNNFFKIFLLSTVLVFNSHSRIHTIKKIAEVAKYINKDLRNFVIFDIDNAILRSGAKADLGSDQWLTALVKQKTDGGMNIGEAFNSCLPLYFHINHIINLVPTEDGVAEVIKDVESKCDHTIALTARSLSLAGTTAMQLDINKIKFNVPEITVDEYDLNLPCSSLYKHGILFCGPNHKGEVLDGFLKATNYKPQLIIMVDDKLKNLQVIEKAVKNLEISFIGLRYAGCDERVANLDMKAANTELTKLLKRYPFTHRQLI